MSVEIKEVRGSCPRCGQTYCVPYIDEWIEVLRIGGIQKVNESYWQAREAVHEWLATHHAQKEETA